MNEFANRDRSKNTKGWVSGDKSSYILSAPVFILSLVLFIPIVMAFWLNRITMLFPQISMTYFVPSFGVLAPVFLIMFVINPVLKLLGRKNFVSAKQLIGVYIVMLVAGTAAEIWLSVLPGMVWLSKLSMDSGGGAEFYQSFVDRLSPLVNPITTTDDFLDFALGADRVPWGKWFMPLIMWSIFVFALFIFFMCLASMFRKDWTEVQHLNYPALVPIVDMTQGIGENRTLFGAFWRNKLMWIGFGISAISMGMWWAKSQYPEIPWVEHRWQFIGMLLSRVWSGNTFLARVFSSPIPDLGVEPMVIGIAYLAPQELLFSWCFFWAFRYVINLVLVSTGQVPFMGMNPQDVHELLAFVTMLTLAVVYVYMSRHYIGMTFKQGLRAIGKDRKQDNSDDEGMGPRTVVLGLGLSTAYLVFFSCVFYGASLFWALALLLVFAATVIVGMRARTELGFTQTQIPHMEVLRNGLIPLLGAKVFGGAVGLIGLGPLHALGFTSQANTMGTSLEAWKAADMLGTKRTNMTRLMILAWVGATIIILFTGLKVGYAYGWSKGWYNYWHFNYLYDYARKVSLGLSTSSLGHLGLWITGAGVTVALMWLRTSFMWWPLHPLGIVLGFHWYYAWITTGSVFFTWACKAVILRYGGMRLYRKLMPLFFGFIAGQITVEILTMIYGIAINLGRVI